MEYKYLKELRKNPTLGKILPIDFNPFKVCSFNCIYCPDGQTTRFLMERENFYPPEEIFEEIEHYLENNEKPDYAWLTGSGEPTLYAGFAQLASLIKEKYPDVKIGVYSNGSLLDRKDVRNDFSLSDLFFVNLNSLDSEEYLKINRHHKDVNLKKIVEGIRLFRKQFNGQLGISTYFIKGINDNNSTVNALKSFLVKVKPDSYVISEFRDKDSQSLSEDFKYLVKETFKDVPFEIVNRLD